MVRVKTIISNLMREQNQESGSYYQKPSISEVLSYDIQFNDNLLFKN
jgi:hypothetical protein